jgi:glycerol-3-phosphate acyltransferase PlsY
VLLILEIILISVASYLIGSITTGDVIARIKKVNLRGQGSGNVGATNVYRTMGSISGIIVLAGDTLKGVIAVVLGNIIGKVNGFDINIVTGVLAIIGHNWPIFAKFKGGKGVAVTLGVAIAMTPTTLFVLIPLWAVVFVCFGYVSLASLVTIFSYPFAVYGFYQNEIYIYKIIFAIVVAIMAIYRHRTNIIRLIKGEEHKILYQKKKEPNA